MNQWRLCVLLTESLCHGGDWPGVAAAAVAGGADCIQLREKDLDDDELLRRTRLLIERCRPRGVRVVVNDRPDVALIAGADGVHLGQADLPCAEARRLLNCASNTPLIGVSTSKLVEAERALRDGADYCGVGPMFPTMTKQTEQIVGPAYLSQFVAWGKLPHLAIGGITPRNIGQLVDAGVRGVAVSSCVCAAPDPQATVRELLQAIPEQPPRQ